MDPRIISTRSLTAPARELAFLNHSGELQHQPATLWA
ncbi:hypothetical protein ACP70R_042467 [Stipagrostis hirtigluma subsp. patula]